ncbi:imidazole glycerol phosphate synthase subunit HisH [Spelaeicoccus albus]|uniref:Imidazole glycerol phosphate synthase subunit HisH n=1 Tax=Spelaeicoccus albus TaxID=1280376 RepID=A0A7Z0IHN0_9MICO|nr:imidazole glycerol phosphate synthase subunit HisH [Spelaeicoccus albus]NYI67835.1 glutamine amidotransferase [Spelaeicoccus albus]
MSTIVVFDYGSGNVRSAVRAAERTGADVVLSSDTARAGDADGVIIPGVGAFASVARGLADAGGDDLIRQRIRDGRPTLAICVGLQVLFERGVEGDIESEGLGIWPGTVTRLRAPVVPHMGWSEVSPPEGSRLFAGIGGERFYFVHSYAASDGPPGALTTWAEHGGRFVAAVEDGPVSATQFHPEKSGEAGRRLLVNWAAGLGADEARPGAGAGEADPKDSDKRNQT